MVKIMNISELFGNIDVLELARKKPSYQRHYDSLLTGRQDIRFIGSQVIITANSIGHFGQGQVAIDNLGKEAQLIFINPFLD